MRMKNGDMPAMPMPLGADGRPWTANGLDNGYAEQCRPVFGLTKREEFTKCAMMAILSNQGMIDILNADTIQWVNKMAIAVADGQLKALEETK